MAGGYMGRIGFVDLPTGEIHEERLDQNLAGHFIGGYGLAVRILFERQKARIDPVGPDNILGFTPWPLTGTCFRTGDCQKELEEMQTLSMDKNGG